MLNVKSNWSDYQARLKKGHPEEYARRRAAASAIRTRYPRSASLRMSAPAAGTLVFHSPGGALTLQQPDVTAESHQGGFHSRTHESGWTIQGELHEAHYVWVNDFSAEHPKFGRVWGNFEDEVHADSEEGFQHFWKNHEPSAWDYHDI